MSIFVQPADFSEGRTKLAINEYNTEALQSYIDEHEIPILQQLLGVDLYNLFIADYNAVPANEFSEARFIAIYNPFALDTDCSVIQSIGIKEMLKHIIFFYYERDNPNKQTSAGAVRQKNDNSTPLTGVQIGLPQVYNTGISTYHAIQYYIKQYNPENYDYSEFNGIFKDFASII